MQWRNWDFGSWDCYASERRTILDAIRDRRTLKKNYGASQRRND